MGTFLLGIWGCSKLSNRPKLRLESYISRRAHCDFQHKSTSSINLTSLFTRRTTTAVGAQFVQVSDERPEQNNNANLSCYSATPNTGESVSVCDSTAINRGQYHQTFFLLRYLFFFFYIKLQCCFKAKGTTANCSFSTWMFREFYLN